MLIVDHSFTSHEDHTISLYRLVPLYSEERQLELREGVAARMRALDAAGIAFVVDMHRRNFGDTTARGHSTLLEARTRLLEASIACMAGREGPPATRLPLLNICSRPRLLGSLRL